MASMSHVRRVILSHNWQNLEEWVCALDQLADLSDEEIEILSSGPIPLDPVAHAAA